MRARLGAILKQRLWQARAPLGQVMEHIVGRDERQSGDFAESLEAGETPRIVTAIEVVGGEIGTDPEVRRDSGGKARKAIVTGRIRRLGRQHDDDLAFAVGDDIGIVEIAFALGSAALAEAQQPRQPAISGTDRGKGEQAIVGEIESAADNEPDPDLFRRMIREHDAGEAVAVGNRDHLMAEWAAVSTNSSGCTAQHKNEKLLVTCNSA
jgi:hypothetical protein